MPLTVDCHGVTDPGRVRRNNQDHFLIADLSMLMHVDRSSIALSDQSRFFGRSQGKLLLVADGVGGNSSGERASQIAVQRMTRYVLDTTHWLMRDEPETEEDFLKASLRYVQEGIFSESRDRPEHRGMGTTLTMGHVVWPRAYVVHAGDSRCYLYSGDTLSQVTEDQTAAQKLIERGVLEPGNVGGLRHWSNVLLSYLGGSSDQLDPLIYKLDLSSGDSLLLCSDGLTKHVTDAEIEGALAAGPDAESICRQLVELANQEGGTDNITVVVARFDET